MTKPLDRAPFREASIRDDAQCLEYFEDVLKDPYADYDLAELDELFREYLEAGAVSKVFLGGLGFLVFSVAAEEVSHPDEARAAASRAIADFALRQAATIHFMRQVYQIDGNLHDPDEICFHRAGTTSYILRVKYIWRDGHVVQDNPLALKILKFRYIDNKTVNSGTRAYQKKYGVDYEHMPRVYASSDRFILMEFIEGQTLAEFMHSQAFTRSRHRKKITKGIILQLIDILWYFAHHPRGTIIHGDLNPKNIIVRNTEHLGEEEHEPDRFDLVLIDFGINYLINEKIGSSRALTRERVYIADELLEKCSRVDMMSDIYSVGVILLEMYNVTPDSDYREFDYREFVAYLDNVRFESPVLASILDDILNKNPALRLFDIQHRYRPGERSNIYRDLRRDLELEFRLAERKSQRQSSVIRNSLVDALRLLTFDFGSVLSSRIDEAGELGRIREADAEEEYTFRRLTGKQAWWAFTAVCSHTAVLIAFVYFLRRYHERGELRRALPGLVVLLSFSFVALKYYLEIFSNLCPKNLGAWGRLTNAWMRCCTFYWPFPIVASFYFHPSFWPFVSCYGTSIVALNNYLCYRLGKNAEREIEHAFPQSLAKDTKLRLRNFGEWWQLMGVYSACMLALGILLTAGLLADEWAYAAITFVINAKMYWYNCSSPKGAGVVQNTLQFYYGRYDRAIKLAALRRSSPAPGPLGSPQIQWGG